jgi:hypothetical protein
MLQDTHPHDATLVGKPEQDSDTSLFPVLMHDVICEVAGINTKL